MSPTVVGEVVVDPHRARIYGEGWQSWSPTTWYDVGRPGLRPREPWQHVMRFRPGTELAADGVQGEGLLVVDPGTGEPVRVWGAPEATTDVPTLHAAILGDRVVVSATGPVEQVTGADAADALGVFGDRFAARAGVVDLRPAPRVWCSWYEYFEDVRAEAVLADLREIGEQELPVDVLQIDDGWNLGLGELNRPAPAVGELGPLVESIRATGRDAGVWLAPFLIGNDTTLARRHPEWLVGPAGRNWRQDLVGLDLTHPGVREYLFETVATLRDAGIRYLKLDFLYGGAVPGPRHEDVPPITAYRSGLELIREAAGPATYLLGSGAPILPSVGLVDAMRVSPDTFHEGETHGSQGLRGRMSLAARAWQHGRFWVNDPDCLVTRPSYPLREEWTRTVETFGGLRSFSDRVASLDDWGLATTRRVLAGAPPPTPFAHDVVRQGATVAHADVQAHR